MADKNLLNTLPQPVSAMWVLGNDVYAAAGLLLFRLKAGMDKFEQVQFIAAPPDNFGGGSR